MALGISIPCHLPADSPALAFLRQYPREHAQTIAHCALLYGVRCLEVVGDGATLSLEQLSELSGFEPHAAQAVAVAEAEEAAPVDRRAGRAAASAAIRGAASAWDDESDAVAAGLRKRRVQPPPRPSTAPAEPGAGASALEQQLHHLEAELASLKMSVHAEANDSAAATTRAVSAAERLAEEADGQQAWEEQGELEKQWRQQRRENTPASWASASAADSAVVAEIPSTGWIRSESADQRPPVVAGFAGGIQPGEQPAPAAAELPPDDFDMEIQQPMQPRPAEQWSAAPVRRKKEKKKTTSSRARSAPRAGRKTKPKGGKKSARGRSRQKGADGGRKISSVTARILADRERAAAPAPAPARARREPAPPPEPLPPQAYESAAEQRRQAAHLAEPSAERPAYRKEVWERSLRQRAPAAATTEQPQPPHRSRSRSPPRASPSPCLHHMHVPALSDRAFGWGRSARRGASRGDAPALGRGAITAGGRSPEGSAAVGAHGWATALLVPFCGGAGGSG